MNDEELNRALDGWKAPEAPAELRGRVLAKYPRPELRSFGRVLRWGLAMAAVVGMLAIGSAQSGGGTMESLGNGIVRLHNDTINWIGDLWVGHIMHAFRHSNPKIYVDGELRSDAEFGGDGVTAWLRLPVEGKYLIGMRRTAFEGGKVPPRAGRFDGHALDFQAGSHTVRVESRGTYGFHEQLPVYVLGPVQR
jgi:hypothetical protein